MKVLVTGAGGFVGANLCYKLHSENICFNAVDDFSFGNRSRLLFAENEKIILCQESDFCHLSEEYLNGFDVLIHLATSNIIYAMDKPIETFQNNALKTIQLFQKFKGKIIYTSTASVYGNADLFPTKETDELKPYNAYDTSKLIAELYLRERGRFTTLRLSNVYGRFQDASNPYCGVLGKFIDLHLEGKPFTIYGDGKATRDYTYVEDVCNAIISAIYQLPYEGEINIATGIETSVLELASLIDENNTVIRMPERSIDQIKRRCLDNSIAKRFLKWTPKTDIKTGIQVTIELKKKG